MRSASILFSLLLALPLLIRAQLEQGIPVTDALTVAKCSSCHAVDDHQNMQRISWERSTPEGWEEALKRMIRANRVSLTPPEARAIVKYLSASHGLAPEESKPVMFYAERRIQDENGMANENTIEACAKCHSMARSLLWRRSADDWKEFTTGHATRYKLKPNPEAVAFLQKAAPLHTPEWTAWSGKTNATPMAGKWLVVAHVAGRGKFTGEMDVQAGANDGEFTTRTALRSINDGSTVIRVGRNVVYAGSAWRGRSKGANAPDATDPGDLASEARETMLVSSDGSTIEGRWFWGQYQEFGFDVKMQRASSSAALLALDKSSLKAGSQANRIRLIGANFPAKVVASDLSAGPGLKVRRIVSSSPTEIAAEIDVAADAALGKRDVTFQSATLSGALAIYDRVDYVRVTPESSMAGFGGQGFTRGYEQFEAIGYQRGADGKAHTADDVELGPVDATWSMEVFYETEPSKNDLVGKISPTGFFTPAAESPGTNYDIWVIATAHDAMKEGKPLVGKGYVVVTIPTYMFEGRKYVRELDRWIEDGRETR